MRALCARIAFLSSLSPSPLGRCVAAETPSRTYLLPTVGPPLRLSPFALSFRTLLSHSPFTLSVLLKPVPFAAPKLCARCRPRAPVLTDLECATNPRPAGGRRRRRERESGWRNDRRSERIHCVEIGLEHPRADRDDTTYVGRGPTSSAAERGRVETSLRKGPVGAHPSEGGWGRPGRCCGMARMTRVKDGKANPYLVRSDMQTARGERSSSLGQSRRRVRGR